MEWTPSASDLPPYELGTTQNLGSNHLRRFGWDRVYRGDKDPAAAAQTTQWPKDHFATSRCMVDDLMGA